MSDPLTDVTVTSGPHIHLRTLSKTELGRIQSPWAVIHLCQVAVAGDGVTGIDASTAAGPHTTMTTNTAWYAHTLRDTGTYFTKGFMSSWPKSYETSFCFNMFNFHSNKPIRSQICTCHDSSAVMACAKLWPDIINCLHVRARHIFTRFGLWAHKMLVKHVPGHKHGSRGTPQQWVNHHVASGVLKSECVWIVTLSRLFPRWACIISHQLHDSA